MRRLLLKAILLLLAVTLGLDKAQGQAINPDGSNRPDSEIQLSPLIAQSRHAKQSRFSLMPSSYRNVRERAFSITPMPVINNQTVFGTGTVGRLTRWTGFTNGQALIGNSTIFEDQMGRVGVGTETPTSRLTVAGLIETNNPGGGIKFPDGTVQTTAGIAPSQVVRSLNGMMGDLSLVAGSNITITPSGDTLTIAAASADDSIQPFQKELQVSLPEGEIAGADTFSVPAGKQLIIEYVSADVSLPDNQNVIQFTVNTDAGGEIVRHSLIPVLIEQSGLGIRRFVASQQVRLYADFGFVTFVLTRNLPTGAGSARMALSGRLVDLP